MAFLKFLLLTLLSGGSFLNRKMRRDSRLEWVWPRAEAGRAGRRRVQ